MDIRIDPLKCTGCGQCTYNCPVGALSIVEAKCVVQDGCVACGSCVDICSFQAISIGDSIMKKGTD